MKRLTLLLLFVHTLILCEAQKIKEIDIPSESIDHFTSKQPARELFRDSSSAYFPIYVIEDIICVTHPRQDNKYAIDFYDKETGDSLGHSIDLLAEDNPWFNPLYSLHQGNIILHDNTVKRIAVIDAKKAVNEPGYTPVLRETNISSTRFAPYGDRLIFWNQYGHDPQFPRIKVSDTEWNYEYPNKININAFNVDHGEILLNQREDIVFFVHKRQPTIEVMDTKGVVNTLIRFNHPATEIASFEMNGIRTFVYKQPLVACFTAASSNEGTVVVSYSESKDSNYILIFDWTGKLITGFKVSGEVYSLSVSNNGEFIYTWENSGNENVLNEYSTAQ